jgi:hypothetical protein
VFRFCTVCERKQQWLDILGFGHVPSITYKIIIFLYRLRAKFFKKILKEVKHMMFKIEAGGVKKTQTFEKVIFLT